MSGRPHERRTPGYGLTAVRCAFVADQFRVTTRVHRYLARIGWSRGTVRSCVASLTPTDFFKSQRHFNRADAWLDIYKPLYKGTRVYVKLTQHENGIEYVVLSFCRDGDQH